MSQKKEMQSPKEKILSLMVEEGIEIKESFSFSLIRPFTAGYLKGMYDLEEKCRGYGVERNSNTLIVPQFTDLNEKEQAIDLAYLWGHHLLMNNKSWWLEVFHPDSYLIKKLGWRKAKEICIKQGIIEVPRKSFKFFEVNDLDFESRKKLSLNHSYRPLFDGLKILGRFSRVLVSVYLRILMILLIIWGLQFSGAMQYIPFKTIVFSEKLFGIENEHYVLSGQEIIDVSGSLYLIVLITYILFEGFKALRNSR
ncbi:hypothetical protein CN432_09565 [Bacillus thuringiensis]|uniref:hypothetical protein n=1 Tax=Bacillus cereus group TaxID=86661 RepID=UPI000BF67CA4|nr:MULTISPECIES: hypothetical protein [Bacillus cereus group]MEB4843123.1 hypothetical protein [Paenibacillus jamilae]MCR6856567.1 hypothetical protein [Bacillus thuringiensis]MEB8830978.1 hypothetical protein [Bacillus cereus]MEB9274846.1 hypothetical protein [Bacillus cereus]MEC3037358.1 hypothetical protein [Bacillus cereus]